MNEISEAPVEPSRSLTLKPSRLAGSECCLNCGTPLQGPFCHYCGQPDKRLLRFFPVLVREFFEDFLELDTRFSRTMKPLLFQPGRLTRDYLDGRRFRYTPPMRLFIFSSMLFFILAATLASNAIELNPGSVRFDNERDVDIGTLMESDEFQTMADEDRERVMEVLREEGLIGAMLQEPVPADEADGGEAARSEAGEDAATGATQGQQAAQPGVEDPESGDEDGEMRIRFNDEDWDRETNPLIIPGMPDSFNDWINDEIEKSPQKAREIEENPNIIVEEFFELLPATMFIMLPIVALLFKFWYLFAKKYYVEHLIHALHNHAFLFVALTITLLNNTLIDWRDPEGNSALWQGLGWLSVAIYIWIPIYLLFSLRTVYQQNWFLTVCKYGVIGISYTVMLTFITTGVALLSFLLL